jgi:amino acid transporter
VDAARHVPRAVWTALLLVAGIVILNAVAVTLAHPDPAAVAAGSDADPVGTAVAESFGSWASRPFAALTLIAFLSCGMAAQGITARAMFSVARDGVLPASGFLRTVNRSGVPIGATIVTAVLACAGMLLGLDSAAIGSVIAFGTAGIYAAFLMVALAALAARLSGRWRPDGHVRLGRWGVPINLLAVAWLAFETVNIAWPRTSIAPPDAPWYQVWAAPLLLLLIAAAGLAYMAAARPWRRAPLTPVAAPGSK